MRSDRRFVHHLYYANKKVEQFTVCKHTPLNPNLKGIIQFKKEKVLFICSSRFSTTWFSMELKRSNLATLFNIKEQTKINLFIG